MTDTLVSTKTLAQSAQAAVRLALRVPVEHDALVPGTRLDEFEIVRVLGAGGFGIVYLAFDHVLQRQVAIKEYMPSALAGRSHGTALALRSPASAETFALGLESFFNEARLLACFDHPSLVKVYRCWKAHGTAYMVMQYYPGITLKQARRGMAVSPDGAWLRAFVEPLLDVLELLHAQGVFHRDIAPDNILLLPDGRPVLLDFGCARRIVGDATQSLTAVLKPNFAPIEQYADVTGMRQGPWTDLYALGATVLFLLTGEAPAPAVLRAVRDELPALSAHGGAVFAAVPARFLAAIDWSLALSPDDRPQTVDGLRQALDGRLTPPALSARQQRSTARRPNHDVHGVRSGDTTAAFDTAVEVQTATIVPMPSSDAASTVAQRHHGARIALALWAVAGMTALGWHLGSPTPAKLTDTIVGQPAAAADTPGQTPAGYVPAAPAGPASAVARTLVPQAAVAAASAGPVLPSNTAVKPAAASPHRPASPDAVSTGPKAACADLNFFARAMCISRECQNPHWRAHPQCAQARVIEEQRQRHKDQL